MLNFYVKNTLLGLLAKLGLFSMKSRTFVRGNDIP